MIRILAGLILWLAANQGIAGEPATVGADLAQQQILVLIRMPPEHFRPGSNYAGGYGDGARRSGRRRIAAQLARAHGLELASDWPVPALGVDCYVLTLPPERADERDALVLTWGVTRG